MRCPKCHYLSFEPEPRCRNCGFDLETHDADPLMADADPVIKDRDAEGPLVDLDLRRPPPAEPRQPVSLGAMRPAREANRPSGYRPPAPRQVEPVESRPRPSAVGLEIDPGRRLRDRSRRARTLVAIPGRSSRGMTQPGGMLPSLLELTFRGPGLKRLELTLPELTLPELTPQS